MRIALVTREYPPETSWGGIGTHYAALAPRLRASGCDVEVFCQGLQTASTTTEQGVQVHRLLPRMCLVGPRRGGHFAGGNAGWIGMFALSLARELGNAVMKRHRMRPFDVIEGHEHLGVMAYLNCRLRGSGLTVVRYQTAYHTFVSRGMARWPRSLLVRLQEHAAIRMAAWRIATSRSIDQIAQSDFPGTPPADVIIPNASQVSPCPERTYPERERLVIFVGRMMPGHKNPDVAAEAFARLAHEFPEWRMEFAGEDVPLEGGGTMWTRCRSILSEFPGRFHYHGILQPTELGELYSRASVSIVPSSIESYGLVALEAMAHGCIPIVSRGTGLEEVVGSAGLCFRLGDTQDLTSQLRRLLRSTDERERRADACRRRTREELGAERVARENLDFFRRVVQESRLRLRSHE